jgi:predicted nuclease of predicted toxin-antitoxin system
MIVSFYFDEMMSRKAAEQIIQHEYNVVMAQDVGMQQKTDSEHLAYATEHKLVLVTFDRPFAGRTTQTDAHAGLICLSGSQDSVGIIVRSLITFAEQHTPESAAGHVFWFSYLHVLLNAPLLHPS